MKIALFTESYLPVLNGVTRSLDTLVPGLRRRGHETMIYAPRARGYADVDPCVRRFPSYYFWGARDYPLAAPFSPRLFAEFARQGFDVVHLQTPFALGLCGLILARRHRIPVIAHMHTLYVDYAHYFPGPRAATRSVIRKMMRWFYSRADSVIVPSPSVRTLLAGYGVQRPIDVIPTGINPPSVTERSAARAAFNLPKDSPVALYTGRLATEKNIGLMLGAFEKIHRRIPESRLLILGGGPARAEAEEMARSMVEGAVIFAGPRSHSDVMIACSAVDIFLFPSQTDTQALSVVEAMACGTPPVVVDAFGPADFVKDGVSGRVVAPTVDAMAEAALVLLLNPAERERLAAGARSAAAGLTADAMTESVLEVYGRVLQTRRSTVAAAG
ncbi:MAG TPA: glycosyltransferase [Armatimonadota bacterium]|nr:glycosyltransferase [Armatimonadota bacterium]